MYPYFAPDLSEQWRAANTSAILGELLLFAAVMRTSVLEMLLERTMRSLVVCTRRLTRVCGAIVPAEFYLPAPPIYCAPMQHGGHSGHHRQAAASNLGQHEATIRMRLSTHVQCALFLMRASRLCTPLVKWYLDELSNAARLMTRSYGVANSFALTHALVNLATLLRYQKLGYVPARVLAMFRDLCAVLFFVEVRDRFALSMRQYARDLVQQQWQQQDVDENDDDNNGDHDQALYFVHRFTHSQNIEHINSFSKFIFF